jgi:Cdc6-like AAA superfamily ATPase
MWSDNETVEDLIGFRVHSELIANVVTDPKLLPVTIGVFGDWGSGKTSIMKMLQRELEQNEDVAVIYFDAWLFEGYDDAKSALISSIIKQLAEHKRFPSALKDRAAKLIQRVNWMRVLKMGWDNIALPAVLDVGPNSPLEILSELFRNCFKCLNAMDPPKFASVSPGLSSRMPVIEQTNVGETTYVCVQADKLWNDSGDAD